ncbi:MAG: aconitase family protein [Candidatus Eisenbacteria bacterium]
MPGHLTALLWTAHGAGWPELGRPVAVRADQVLLDDELGLVSLLLFEALRESRHACDLALVAPGREASGPDAHEDQRYLLTAAAACGATFVRPGAGLPAAVHRRRYAAPGRSRAATAAGCEGAGAFAMPVLRAGAVELAAALAGEPLVRPRPAVTGVELTGVPRAGVGGAEIVRALGGVAGERARGSALECFGDGLAALPMEDASRSRRWRLRCWAATAWCSRRTISRASTCGRADATPSGGARRDARRASRRASRSTWARSSRPRGRSRVRA